MCGCSPRLPGSTRCTTCSTSATLHRLADYPYLWEYARDLYQRPGFGDTTDFVQIKRHYYQTQVWINPTGIVPKGPYVSWLEPHGRERMRG